MMMRQISIDVVPVPWARPRASRNGGYFTAPRQNKFKAEVTQSMRLLWDDKPWQGAISLSMIITIERPKSVKSNKRPWPAVKPDLDNFAKGILDCGNGVIWEDDAQIVQLSLQKQYGPKPGVWIGVARFSA